MEAAPIPPMAQRGNKAKEEVFPHAARTIIESKVTGAVLDNVRNMRICGTVQQQETKHIFKSNFP